MMLAPSPSHSSSFLAVSHDFTWRINTCTAHTSAKTTAFGRSQPTWVCIPGRVQELLPKQFSPMTVSFEVLTPWTFFCQITSRLRWREEHFTRALTSKVPETVQFSSKKCYSIRATGPWMALWLLAAEKLLALPLLRWISGNPVS